MTTSKTKFWREKNALSQSALFEVSTPSQEELATLLNKKFIEKSVMFASVFSEEAVLDYLTEKMQKTKNLDKKATYEAVIAQICAEKKIPVQVQAQIMKWVLIDLLQLEKDYFKVNKIKVGMNYKTESKFINKRSFNAQQVSEELISLSQRLQSENYNNLKTLAKIHRIVEETSMHFGYDFNKQIKPERLQVEEKEGSFAKGLVIHFDKPKEKESQPLSE